MMAAIGYTLTAEQARRRRRRSVALACVLALLVLIFYAMAILHGPSIAHRPI